VKTTLLAGQGEARGTFNVFLCAGEMLLSIEARIGELSITAPRTPPRYDVGRGAREAAGPLKAERLGLTPARMKKSEAIHRNPAAVIREAREKGRPPVSAARRRRPHPRGARRLIHQSPDKALSASACSAEEGFSASIETV
jgi:hypothetical protein